jgi:hypothetical protein
MGTVVRPPRSGGALSELWASLQQTGGWQVSHSLLATEARRGVRVRMRGTVARAQTSQTAGVGGPVPEGGEGGVPSVESITTVSDSHAAHFTECVA